LSFDIDLEFGIGNLSFLIHCSLKIILAGRRSAVKILISGFLLVRINKIRRR